MLPVRALGSVASFDALVAAKRWISGTQGSDRNRIADAPAEFAVCNDLVHNMSFSAPAMTLTEGGSY